MDDVRRVRTSPVTETWMKVMVVSVSAEMTPEGVPDIIADIETVTPFRYRGVVRVHPDDYNKINDGKFVYVVAENIKWMSPTPEKGIDNLY